MVFNIFPISVENCVSINGNPDHRPQSVAADLGLHCIPKLIIHVRDHENKKYKSSCQYIHSRQHIYNTLKGIVTLNCGKTYSRG